MSTQRISSTRVHRTALVANACFSATTGALAVGFPNEAASWLGDVSALAVTAVGVSLLGFAGFVGHTAARWFRDPIRVGVISVADLAWVGGTAFLLMVWPALFGAQGIGTMIAIAAIVGAFGVLQLYGTVAQFRHRSPGAAATHHVEIEVVADAPADALWNVVRDLGSIADYSDGLKSSAMLVGTRAEVGAVRRCVDTSGRAWNESCTVVEPGHSLVLDFDAQAPGFPFPFRAITGGWVLEPAGATTIVRLWWDLTPERGLKGDLIVAAMAATAPRGMRRLVAKMAEEARREVGRGAAHADADAAAISHGASQRHNTRNPRAA